MKKAMKAIDAFNKERDWDQFHTPANLAKSIVIEGAELLECFQWNDKEWDRNAVEEELADVLSYALQMCMVLKTDPEAIVLKKLEKTRVKYPVEKAKGSSTKYDQLD